MKKLLEQLRMNGPIPNQIPTGLTSKEYGDGCKCHGRCPNCWVVPPQKS
ncbi:MAG: hypothetical protein UT66_C0041G0004 [candidate division CPR2 bacterium GW2011_GWC1_39_9]|uniref:Uncharacterized protein n=1 Tax=candidate division CPR2 bacterium GW2011_GWC2_39_10 TaxID=1618345 RepID=A0A0G0LNN0_UNCC2|nr:MAG: hypothetical protein UT18_C0019G0015 [candidate division CPR2 bacterium GW2011_GWC2_39_10]KKR33313.1 MAG: hypothetical protein UT66_C0041G0004 [candidate division CPR2 bacterium GW2011_GWC1_39_9]